MATVKPTPTNPSAEKPVLLEAINLTMRTIERRTRMYRNLVIAVSITGLALPVFAFILRRWVVLAGWLVLPLYVRLFLAMDNKSVNAWRAGIFQMRDQRGLDIAQLVKALAGFQHLPQGTLRAMVALLTAPGQGG